MSTPQKPRSQEDAAYCWLAKSALRLLREALDSDPDGLLRDCVATYTALCEYASDREAEAFAITTRRLTERSGVCRSNLFAALTKLEELGLIHREKRRMPGNASLGASMFTLLPCTFQGTPSPERRGLPSSGSTRTSPERKKPSPDGIENQMQKKSLEGGRLAKSLPIPAEVLE